MQDTESKHDPYLSILRDRINLEGIPFTDRGSRILVGKEAGESALCIRLAERWSKWENEVGPYRNRKPIVDDWRFTDANGSPLDFQATTWPHVVHLETACGRFWIAFLDAETLYVSLPIGRSGFSFLVYADTAAIDRRGGVLRGNRNLAYTTSARLVGNTIKSTGAGWFRVSVTVDATEGDGLVLNVTPRLGFNRSIPAGAEVRAAAARRWHDWFAAAPTVDRRFHRQYYYAWWIMRAGLIGTRFYTTREVMLPSKIHYVGAWQWDSFFHALAYRHMDQRLAEDQLRILLDHQRADGMIPDAVHDEGVVTHLAYPVDADVTKPPLIAWAALKLYDTSGHLDFLQEVYEPISRWNDWWFAANDANNNGLAEYRHPFSSGMDDSPLWDGGMPVESPDLNAYLVLQMECLGRIADLIGEREAAQTWRFRADETARLMTTELWDSDAGLFWPRRQGQPVHVLTPVSLLPLLTARLPEPVNDRLVAHLTDERTFWPRFPVPSVALSDPRWDPEQMWRGPTWVNHNYLFVEALNRVGRTDIARALRERTLELVMNQDDIYEYYHPVTGERPPKAAPLFGWSAAVFIDLAIQASREQGSPARPARRWRETGTA